MNSSTRYFTYGTTFGLMVGALFGACLYSLADCGDFGRPLATVFDSPNEEKETISLVAEILAEKQHHIRDLEKQNEILDGTVKLLLKFQKLPEPTPLDIPQQYDPSGRQSL